VQLGATVTSANPGDEERLMAPTENRTLLPELAKLLTVYVAPDERVAQSLELDPSLPCVVMRTLSAPSTVPELTPRFRLKFR
jgi:hypothetical protein